MADFVAVLKKTIDGLGNNTPEMREKVYDKARATVAAKLAAINPPPPAARGRAPETRARRGDHARSRPAMARAADPFAELENVFADIDRKPDKPADVAVTSRERRSRRPCSQDRPSIRSHGRAARRTISRPSRRRRPSVRRCRSTATRTTMTTEEPGFEEPERAPQFCAADRRGHCARGGRRRRLCRLAEQGRFPGDAGLRRQQGDDRAGRRYGGSAAAGNGKEDRQ